MNEPREWVVIVSNKYKHEQWLIETTTPRDHINTAISATMRLWRRIKFDPEIYNLVEAKALDELQAKYDDLAQTVHTVLGNNVKLKEHAEALACALDSTWPDNGVPLMESCKLITKAIKNYRKDFPKGGKE